MTFSTNGSAVLLLFVAIFGVVSLSAALLVTTDLIVRDCVHVDGGSGCATFDQIASSQDIKRADAGVIHGLQPDPTHVKRAIPDGTTLTCDTTRAPLSKSAVKSAFIEKFCGRIDGEVFRQSGIDEVCTELITKMYMFVSTINGDWVYVNEKDLCIDSFMLIIDGCTDATGLRGGIWQSEHVKYIIRVVQIGGMTGKEPECVSRT